MFSIGGGIRADRDYLSPMSTTRRDFLKTAAAGALAALMPEFARAAADRGLPLVKLSDRIRAPLLGIGTGMKGGNRSNALLRAGEQHFLDTIRLAYDEGVRLFDLADMYGSHQPVAKALKGRPRDSFILVSKIWLHPKGGLPESEPRLDANLAVERFLKELETDYVDLVQLHCQTDAQWTDKMRRQMDLLEACKQKGQIRAHGCSCHSIAALEAAAADPWVDVVHTRINPWGVKMDGPADQVVPVLRRIHAAGKGIIGMKLVGEGAFKGDDAKINESLNFALNLGCIDAMIVGFESPAELLDYKRRLTTNLATRVQTA